MRVSMRTLCDACESAAAVLFCAADEASLCQSCDDKIHTCNRLASRHVRVGLADPIDVPHCDICENTPAFFYCEVDGSSLCLQCDMAVHVGGKRKHRRYLLFRQRVEFPGDTVDHAKEPTSQLMDEGENNNINFGQNQSPKPPSLEDQKIRPSPDPKLNTSGNEDATRATNMFDLNMYPHRIHGEASSYQEP